MKKRPISAVMPLEQNGAEKSYVFCPESFATLQIQRILSAPAKMLQDGEEIRKSTSRMLRDNDGSVVIAFDNDHIAGQVVLNESLVKGDHAVRQNTTTGKFFDYILMKAREQIITDGGLTDSAVYFPLSDVVRTFEFESEDVARKAFKNSVRALRGLSVEVWRKSKRDTADAGRDFIDIPIVGKCGSTNGVLWVQLCNDVQWNILAENQMILPRKYFSSKISQRTAELLRYLSYLARINSRDVAEHGYFTVKLDTLRDHLHMPAPEDTKNPARDIKEAIEKCVVEIEDYQTNDGVPEEQLLRFEYIGLSEDHREHIQVYLRNGRLKVYCGAEHVAAAAQISGKKVEYIEAGKKKRGRPRKSS